MSDQTVSKSKLVGSRRLGALAAAGLILVFQAGASRMLKIDERSIPIPGLHSLPGQLGPWKATAEQSMDPSTEAYLKPDEYIMRNYVDEQGGTPIDLFVAYFKSLQNTFGPHSPSVCLPGAGWLVSSSKIVSIPVPGRAAGIPVNEYLMEKGGQRILVLFWYQNGRDIWAQEFHAKLRLLPDLLRYRRSDVSLVRLISPVQSSSGENELASNLRFTELLYPSLVDRFASVH
jgi:EpsI family protein